MTLVGEPGKIFVNGHEVGQGTFRGPLPPGLHHLKVERAGSETFETEIQIVSAEVQARFVTLRQGVSAEPAAALVSAERYGLYGGAQLFASFQPLGSGTTLQNACETTGATNCSAGTNIGAGLVGYLGWLFDPLGIELAVLLSSDMVNPVASFDGTNGSDINPVVATPERDENFTIGRFGGGGAIRGRFVHEMKPFRFSAAAGPGLFYRVFAYQRQVMAADGSAGKNGETGPSYVSLAFLLELSGEWEINDKLAMSLSLLSWFEAAGGGATSAARNDIFIDSNPPIPLATPAYQLASGPQWFLGPALGLVFGP